MPVGAMSAPERTACSARSWPATSPRDVVQSTDDVVAFRDVNPQAPTHVLVIPRDHHAERRRRPPRPTRRLAVHLVDAAAGSRRPRGSTDYRLVFNTGAGAGQTVFHTHLHVLGGRAMTWPPG